MIAADQPTLFDDSLIVALSSAADGNMSFSCGDDETTFQNRLAFLHAVGIDPAQATLVYVTYGDTDFARYHVVTAGDKGEGMFAPKCAITADALVATTPGHALFLPIADCAGLIIHDPVCGVLMVSHVGRHSAEIDGAGRSVDYVVAHCGSQPENLKVWVSPAVGQTAYPIHTRGGLGLHEVIRDQLTAAGVPDENQEFSTVDTATDHDYFSHSEFLAGRRQSNGRFAIVAQTR